MKDWLTKLLHVAPRWSPARCEGAVAGDREAVVRSCVYEACVAHDLPFNRSLDHFICGRPSEVSVQFLRDRESFARNWRFRKLKLDFAWSRWGFVCPPGIYVETHLVAEWAAHPNDELALVFSGTSGNADEAEYRIGVNITRRCVVAIMQWRGGGWTADAGPQWLADRAGDAV